MPSVRKILLVPVVVLLAGVTMTAPPAGAAGERPADPPQLRWKDTDTGTDARLRGLDAVSWRTAWASGTEGTVLRTTDAGHNWRSVGPKGTEELQFRDVEAFSATSAVVLSIGEGEDSRIYRTADGGKSWRRTFVNKDPRAFYDCMAFWDDRNGIALSDPVDGKFRILATDDGGRSWGVVDPAGMPAALEGEFAFAASGTCLVTAGRQDAWIASGGGAEARVFHTSDRGRTWTVTDTPVRSTDAGGIFSLAFPDRHRGIAVGGDFLDPERGSDSAAWTADGGATWHPARNMPGGYRSGSAWVPNVYRTAIAVGPTGTDVSRNGGRSWHPMDGGSLDSVDCAPAGGCWGSGDLGRVARLIIDRG